MKKTDTIITVAQVEFKLLGCRYSEIFIDLKQAEQGWVSLGTYEFSKDHYKLILHDSLNNPNFYIIADAVKWKKQ